MTFTIRYKDTELTKTHSCTVMDCDELLDMARSWFEIDKGRDCSLLLYNLPAYPGDLVVDGEEYELHVVDRREQFWINAGLPHDSIALLDRPHDDHSPSPIKSANAHPERNSTGGNRDGRSIHQHRTAT
jgi:hypothetical protein